MSLFFLATAIKDWTPNDYAMVAGVVTYCIILVIKAFRGDNSPTPPPSVDPATAALHNTALQGLFQFAVNHDQQLTTLAQQLPTADMQKVMAATAQNTALLTRTASALAAAQSQIQQKQQVATGQAGSSVAPAAVVPPTAGV